MRFDVAPSASPRQSTCISHCYGTISLIAPAADLPANSGGDEDGTIHANVVYGDGDRGDVDFNELSDDDAILSKAEGRVYLDLHNKPEFGWWYTFHFTVHSCHYIDNRISIL